MRRAVLGVPISHAARRVALVVGAGALGAAVCSAGVHLTRPSQESLQAVRAEGPPTTGSPITPAEQQAIDLLHRGGTAEHTVAYRGTKLFASWSSLGSMSVLADVSHQPGQPTRVAIASAGSSSVPQQQLVDNDVAADLDEQALGALTRRYTLRIAEHANCVGRSATVVEVARGSAVAGRFWLDDESGLVLRRELYDKRGERVRATAFLDLRIGGEQPATLLGLTGSPSALPSADADHRLSPRELSDLRRAGLVLPDLLPGGFVLFGSRQVTVGGADAVQLTYSDGLFAFSLFAQAGRLPARLPGLTAHTIAGTTVYVRPGLYRQLTWAGDDNVYTLVTDAPDDVVTGVIRAMPHRPPDSGFLGRVSKGIVRMGSWVNPFD